MNKQEISVAVESVRAVCFGLTAFDAADEARDLAMDTMRRWNPRAFDELLRRVGKDEIRITSGESLDALLRQLKSLGDTEFPDCDLIIQHGEFELMKRSTGSSKKVPVVLGIFLTSTGKSKVTVAPGLDTALIPAVATGRDQEDPIYRFLTGIPTDQRGKLVNIREALLHLALTDKDRAGAELEAHNVARRTVWGDQAAVIPIARGALDDVLEVVFSCISNDFKLRQAKSVEVEAFEAVDSSATTQQQLEALSPQMRSMMEQRIAKHRRENAGGGNKSAAARKYQIRVHFPQTFGKHEVFRVGSNSYLAMACSIDIASVPDPLTQSQPTAAAQPISIRPLFAGRSRTRKILTGCLVWLLLVVAVNAIMSVVLTRRSKADRVLIPGQVAWPYSARIGNEPGIPAAKVSPEFFQHAGVSPTIGRFFHPADFETDQGTAILSDLLWRTRYSRAPDIVGSTIVLDGKPTVVIGIAPADFTLPENTALWVPAR